MSHEEQVGRTVVGAMLGLIGTGIIAFTIPSGPEWYEVRFLCVGLGLCCLSYTIVASIHLATLPECMKRRKE